MAGREGLQDGGRGRKGGGLSRTKMLPWESCGWAGSGDTARESDSDQGRWDCRKRPLGGGRGWGSGGKWEGLGMGVA